VRALDSAHTALRPDGLLLDIHPEPEHAWVEAHTGGRVVRLGQIDDPFRNNTVQAARAVLRDAVHASQFIEERSTRFVFVYHFDSVETWLTYMKESWSTARIDEDVIARCRAALDAASGEICVLRAVRATRYRRG
jgi:hypothetical protein